VKAIAAFFLRNLALSACLLFAGCGGHQALPASPCDAQADSVRTIADLAYEPHGDSTRFDLYVPAHRAGEPLVVFAHGGGWVGGDRRSYGHLGYAFARCGIAFANLNYPLAPRAHANQQADAIVRAAQWLREHAPAFGYAADRMFLMGHSSGAELVSLAGMRATARGRGSALPFSGVVAVDGLAYDPATDFPGAKTNPDLQRYYFAAFGPSAASWQRFSAQRAAHVGAPPFLLVHALDDNYAPARDSERFADALRSSGVAVTYLQPSGRDHNTVISNLNDSADPTATAIETFIFSNGAETIAMGQQRASSSGIALAAGMPSAAKAPQARKLPRPDHVVIVMEENHSFSSIIGNADAPYLNKLAAQGALFTQSYAITHPSQPNYIALFAGEINRNGDGCPEEGVPADAPNLASELIAAHLSFAGYSETLPHPGFTGCFAGFAKWSYARKHNPWVSFTNVPASSNLPFSALPHYQDLPTVAYIVPNQAHDMHSGSVADADSWLQSNVGALIDWSATHNTLVIITWDEDDRGENNRIPTIFVGPMVKSGRDDERIDHYSVLRTLEDIYGLQPAGNSRASNTITAAWR